MVETKGLIGASDSARDGKKQPNHLQDKRTLARYVVRCEATWCGVSATMRSRRPRLANWYGDVIPPRTRNRVRFAEQKATNRWVSSIG